MPKGSGRKPNYLMIMSIVLLVGFGLWNYYSSWVVSQLSLEIVRQGWVKHEKTVKGVFANTEVVLTAPAEGKVILFPEEGRRLKKGETVAKLESSGVDHGPSREGVLVTAPISGLFYSARDGLEQVITPESLMSMELDGLLSQVGNLQQSTENDKNIISKHSPVGKMVNNLYPSWAFVYLETTDNVKKDDIVKFSVEGEEYTGTVMKLSGNPQGAVVRFSQYVKGTTEKRIKDVIWINKPPSKGLLVPTRSLCTFGEERGVYYNSEGIARFKNVRVLDYNDDVACISGLPEGVQVITNPRKGIEGLTLRIKI
jgi:hypothetical protein